MSQPFLIKKADTEMVGRPVDVKKIVSLWLAGVVLIAGLVAVVVARDWPFSQERITHSLQSTFPVTVKFQKFHSTYFPHRDASQKASFLRDWE